MATILLMIIYIAAVSLGVPNSLLGAGGPAMCMDLEGSVLWIGILSSLISAGTIVSSVSSWRLIRKFGVGKVTVFSVGMSALALMGFSMSREFWNLCLWAIPYGLGSGCVDVALNNYVAVHYKARHMNWLHCLWGIGAVIGPLIMGKCLTGGLKWTAGYQITGIFQIILTTVLFCVLSFWEKLEVEKDGKKLRNRFLTWKEVLGLPSAKTMLIESFCYSALESTVGLWAGSYMVFFKGIDVGTAAAWTVLFYLGMVAGCFLNGFLTELLSDRGLIRIGQLASVAGIGCMMLPGEVFFWQIGLLFLGFGLSPVYPSLLHSIPRQFGEEKSQMVMGVQLAFSHGGRMLIPLLIGWIAERTSMESYPLCLFFLLLILSLMAERRNWKMRKTAERRMIDR